jgi:hypothetical protein
MPDLTIYALRFLLWERASFASSLGCSCGIHHEGTSANANFAAIQLEAHAEVLRYLSREIDQASAAWPVTTEGQRETGARYNAVIMEASGRIDVRLFHEEDRRFEAFVDEFETSHKALIDECVVFIETDWVRLAPPKKPGLDIRSVVVTKHLGEFHIEIFDDRAEATAVSNALESDDDDPDTDSDCFCGQFTVLVPAPQASQGA